MTDEPVRERRHVWVSNRAFTRMTGLTRVCMDCGLALERGERLVEKVCPGPADRYTPPDTDGERAMADAADWLR